MKHATFIPCGIGRRQHGRTLIELLIAMTLSLMIVAAVGVLYSASSSSSRTAQQLGGAEERGQLALFFLGEPITLASFGNINSGEFTRPRFQAVSFQEPHLRACSNGRFQNAMAGDFTCVPSASPGDALYIGYQSESAADLTRQGLPTTVAADCLGQDAADGNVANLYSIEPTGDGTLEFGCTGSVTPARQGLVRYAEDFKVYFAMDSNSHAMSEAGGAPHTFRPSALLTATQINALPGALDPANSAGNPWNHVIAVYVCVLTRTREAGTTLDGTSTFEPCPQDETEAASGVTPTTANDGIARRSYTQVYTIRARSQARAGSQAQM